MLKQKIAGALISLALVCAGMGALLLGGANASAAPTTPSASLFLPVSYEQYLVLEKPVDVAISDKYIAIADGNVLFVYDRAGKSYSKTDIPDKETSTITKIGFAGDRLFVSTRGTSNSFYEYDFSGKQLDKLLAINCSTFCIGGDTLYTANVGGQQTTIGWYAISDLKSTNPNSHFLGTLNKNTTPSMTLLNGTLYCTVNDLVYYNDLGANQMFSDDNCFYLSLNAPDNQNVQSTCAHENVFYYTAAKGLFRTEFSEGEHSSRAVCVLEGENYGALTSYNGALYCLRGKAVVELKVNDDGTVSPTSYEISSSSSSLGRLSSAKDIVRAGDLLVTADTGNSRITVYDMQKRSFAVIETDFSPTLVATDGSVIAAASGNKVYVCEDPSKNQTFGEPVIADLGTIKGLACVHGSVYYITEYGYGKVEEEDFGLVSRLEDPLVALTADDNGILYVVDSKGYVRYYHEDEFIDTSIASGGDAGLTLHMPISSLRADRNGNLYYIHKNEIWKNDTLFFKIDDKLFAYGDENELISFAFGFEDNEVFLLYENHIIKTAIGALNIPAQDGTNTFVSHVEILLPRDKGRRYYL